MKIYDLLRIIILVMLLSYSSVCFAEGCFYNGAESRVAGLTKTSGNLILDNKFNVEAGYLYNIFHVSPSLWMFSDYPANAYADVDNNCLLFGRTLLVTQLWENGGFPGEHAIAGIMAHEFAHFYQDEQELEESVPTKELQADYLAGYYLGIKSYFAPTNIEVFARSLYEMGDYGFRSPQHHGTPKQRITSMVAGFQAAKRGTDLDDAYDNGLIQAKNLQRSDPNQSIHIDPDPSSTGSNTEFCSVLKQVLDASEDSFDDIKGEKIPSIVETSSVRYSTDTKLPGARKSVIYISLGSSKSRYSCSFDYQTRTEAETQFNSLKASLRMCLPTSHFEDSMDDGKPECEVKDASNRKIIRFYLERNDEGKFYNVIWVYAR